jgi:hypothetical protein
VAVGIHEPDLASALVHEGGNAHEQG